MAPLDALGVFEAGDDNGRRLCIFIGAETEKAE
jgi:hypothetical protein